MKKPLSEKTQVAVFRALLKNYRRAMSNPRIAKSVFLSRTFFNSERTREAVFRLMLCSGDWQSVKNWLSKNPAPWHGNLFKWADKIQGNLL
jgi:hypothetical protein